MNTSTLPDTPAGVSGAFATAINAGDLDGALLLYRDDAVLLSPDGNCARGVAAIRELLAGLISMDVEMTMRVKTIIVTDDFALASEDWTMRLATDAGDGGEQRGQSVVGFARGADGWRFVIDAPWGLG
jgi:uncharacterized protein (TIGR02246 family)